MLDPIYLICMPTIAYLFCVAMSYQSILSICRGECILPVSPRNVSRCCRPHRRRARARRRRPPSPTAAAAKSPPPFNQRRGGGRRSLVPKILPSRNNTLQPQIPRRKVARCSPLLPRRSPGTLPLCRPAPLPGVSYLRRALLGGGSLLIRLLRALRAELSCAERKRSNDAAAH
jgi:hypothetical protein